MCPGRETKLFFNCRNNFAIHSSMDLPLINNAESSENDLFSVDDLEEPTAPIKSKMRFWFVIGAAIVVTIGAIALCCVLFIVPSTEPTFRTFPPRTFNWIKDVDFHSSSTTWRVSLFSGLVTFSRMTTLCNRIKIAENNNNSLPSILNIDAASEEAVIDAIIRGNKDVIFASISENQRLLWTGLFFSDYDQASRKWMINTMEKDGRIPYTNFCDPSWEMDLDENKNNFDWMFVVKDYRGNRIDTEPACWRLVGTKRDGDEPRFSFICSSRASNTTTTGQIAERPMPGQRIEQGSFIVYGAQANYEDAVAECQAQGAHLVTYDTEEKAEQLEQLLEETVSLRSSDGHNNGFAFSWTGRHIDMKNKSRSICQNSKQSGRRCNLRASGLKMCQEEFLDVSINLMLNATKLQPDYSGFLRLVIVRDITWSSDDGDGHRFCLIPLPHPFPKVYHDPKFQDPEFFILCEKH